VASDMIVFELCFTPAIYKIKLARP